MTIPPQTLWVLTPVGQRADGTYVDHALQEASRNGETVRKIAGSVLGLPQRMEVFRSRDAEADVNATFYQRGWTDGLPVVPPTVGRVREMLRYAPESANTVIAELGPMLGQATLEKIAANAVMAGCIPEYLPVVLAAVRGIGHPDFNLRGVQMTDENVTPLLIVSGPITDEIDINAGIGGLGPGWKANATIGRALRLIMINIGGGWPGTGSLAGIGQPGRYTLCIGENLAASPWAGLQTECGFDAGDSVVTLLRAESCVNVTGGLEEIASAMASAVSIFSVIHGGFVAVLLAPATARRLDQAGWSKSDIVEFLFQHGRIPLKQWRRFWVRERITPNYGLPEWVQDAENRQQPIPVVKSAKDIVLFVAGGEAPIPQHVYFPTWGFPPCRLVLPILQSSGRAERSEFA